MDEILFLISLVREWLCDESWMRNRGIARCNRTARQCHRPCRAFMDYMNGLAIYILKFFKSDYHLINRLISLTLVRRYPIFPQRISN